MSMFLEDAQSLFEKAEYALGCVIGERKNAEDFCNKNPTDNNKAWLLLEKKKEICLYAAVDELRELVEACKIQEQMMQQE